MQKLSWTQAKRAGWATPWRTLVRISIMVLGFVVAWQFRSSLVGPALVAATGVCLDYLFMCWAEGRNPQRTPETSR